MKKNLLFIVLIAIASFMAVTNAGCKTHYADVSAGKEYTREVVKDFTVDSLSSLSIDNKYGNIRIVEGGNGKISFKIEITGKGHTAELAKQYAETVSIVLKKTDNKISAVTKMASLSCNNCGRTVNYTVVVPKDVAMNLVNKYGNIFLNDAIKPLTVNVKYGNITANSVDVAKIEIKYGTTELASCKDAAIETAYGTVKIGSAGKLAINSKYDKITLGTVSYLTLSTDYTNVGIDKINKRFVCSNIKYGNITINNVAADFQQIKISAKYSNTRIAFTKQHSFKANLSAKYGDINTGDLIFNGVKNNASSDKNTKTLTGSFGTNPTATLEIDTTYGNIRLD